MTSLSVRCLEGFNGGLQQQFSLEVKDTQTSELRANITSPVPRFTVNSLSPSSIYSISIYAFNSKGRSDPSILPATMQRMPEKPLTGEKGKKYLYKIAEIVSIVAQKKKSFISLFCATSTLIIKSEQTPFFYICSFSLNNLNDADFVNV